MKEKLCDKKDCPLYNYKEKHVKKEPQEDKMQGHYHNVSFSGASGGPQTHHITNVPTWTSIENTLSGFVSSDNSITLETKNCKIQIQNESPHVCFNINKFNVPLECLLCKHRDSLDMYEKLMVSEAKKELLK